MHHDRILGSHPQKQSFAEINKHYDFVIMNHAFEHTLDPLATLRQLWRVLKPNRYALIRIPIAPSFAWQKYGVNWVQLDAPRHLFIHTVSSMRMLAEAANLTITKIFFDSDHFQFTGSERYLRGIPHSQPDEVVFSQDQLATFHREAEKLNREGKGDQAGFFI
jgi:SAM-dependent methyltransferase